MYRGENSGYTSKFKSFNRRKSLKFFQAYSQYNEESSKFFKVPHGLYTGGKEEKEGCTRGFPIVVGGSNKGGVFVKTWNKSKYVSI